VATITGGRTARTVRPCDTPETVANGARHQDGQPHAQTAESAAAAWRSAVPALAGTPHVRLSFDGGRTYPARHARRLPADPPESHPCVVPVYDPAAAEGRMLALDFDPSRGDVDHHAAELGHLLERIGARYVADVAPSRGRHLYVPFSSSLPWTELRDLVRAMSLRFPAIDPAPMCALGGQISPPGSRHKSGGWRLLSTPLSEARAAVEHPNGPEVWTGLLSEFAAELQTFEMPKSRDFSAVAELDDVGVPWVPRLGGRSPLGAELDHVARTGHCPGRGRSEARMAVLSAAAARGWRLADVLQAVSCGAWKGFPGLYARASEPGRMDRLLPLEWRKSIAFVAGEKNVRGWLTSDIYPRPPADTGGPSAEYGHIRRWVTATDCAAEDPERVRRWGRKTIAVRQLLAAIGQAAIVSGSVVIEFGTRNLSLHSGLSQRTVSRLLRLLREEPDPILDLVSRRQAARADRYALRIPDKYADSVRWRRRRAGRIEAIHPVFALLGGTAALVYQVLDGTEARGAEVARAARLSASAVSVALRTLAEHGLAERGPGGWQRGPADLDEVAESTGAADIHRERAERYKQDRESWQARLREYVGARSRPVTSGDGFWPLDDEDEWRAILFGRWPVHRDDPVRGPPDLTGQDREAG